VRLRSLFLAFVCGCALSAPAEAAAYPWPIKPFDTQHPIRAYFGDPRTRFLNTLLTNGLEGPGTFLFHNGIDISAPGGTPVYPVVSGTAKLIDGAAVSVRTKDRGTFQYFHIIPTIFEGQRVVARRTVLGHVMRVYEHVHLTEIRSRRVRNPVALGGIAPYRDSTVPQVESISARPTSSQLELDPSHLCGIVSLVAKAFDTPPLPVPGAFAGFPVSPAFISWSLVGLSPVASFPEVIATDFRTTLPSARDFWNVYARGTFQNAPRFSNRQFFMRGRFLYNLARYFDTRAYANGLYELTVRASDMRGNESEALQRFTIVNRPGTETGCPPAPKKA
jgi:hypothetical protein